MVSDDPFSNNGFDGGISGGEFEAVVDVRRAPEGICIVQLMNVSQERSKSSGNKMWVWEFAIRKYTDPAEVGDEFNGEIVKVFTALSKSAMWKLEETLKALGVKIGDAGAVKFSKDQVIGVVCKAAIEHSVYNDKPQVNIKALAPHPSGAGTKEPLPDIHGTSAGFGEDIPF